MNRRRDGREGRGVESEAEKSRCEPLRAESVARLKPLEGRLGVESLWAEAGEAEELEVAGKRVEGRLDELGGAWEGLTGGRWNHEERAEEGRRKASSGRSEVERGLCWI